jgi:hypothetical protein
MRRNSLTSQIIAQKQAIAQANYYHELMRQEGEIGGQLFGALPAGRKRDFFLLDAHTWVWHEEWRDTDGQTKFVTTNYCVRPNGIVKTVDGRSYHGLSRSEAINLRDAVKQYYKKVMTQLYHQAV